MEQFVDLLKSRQGANLSADWLRNQADINATLAMIHNAREWLASSRDHAE